MEVATVGTICRCCDQLQDIRRDHSRGKGPVRSCWTYYSFRALPLRARLFQGFESCRVVVPVSHTQCVLDSSQSAMPLLRPFEPVLDAHRLELRALAVWPAMGRNSVHPFCLVLVPSGLRYGVAGFGGAIH